MGSKMGKQKTYKRKYQKKQYDTFYKSTGCPPQTGKDVTYQQKIADGKRMYDAVLRERARHFIGEHIIFKRKKTDDRTNDCQQIVDGFVTGVFPHFILLKCGYGDRSYSATISYVDLLIGGDAV